MGQNLDEDRFERNRMKSLDSQTRQAMAYADKFHVPVAVFQVAGGLYLHRELSYLQDTTSVVDVKYPTCNMVSCKDRSSGMRSRDTQMFYCTQHAAQLNAVRPGVCVQFER